MSKENKNKKKKIKAILIAIVSLIVVLSMILVVIFTALLKDKNRSNHTGSEITYSEIIKKNYINGFRGISTSGEFSFSLDNSDINELLSVGVKEKNDRYIENIYYESKDEHHYFYVDLTHVLVKSRVVVDTVKSPLFEDGETHLIINRCTIGKADALAYLQKKGYLTSDWINDYFTKCHLPISYNQDTLSFVIKAPTFINDFPSSKLGDTLFSLVKDYKDSFIKENSSLFGFNVDFTKLGADDEFTEVDTSSELSLYQNIKDGCESVDFTMMTIGESKVGYSLKENELDILVNKVIGTSFKEEIKSEYTSNKVYFDLKGVKTSIEEVDNIKIKLYYSVNDYLIKVDEELEFLDLSTTSKFNSLFEAKPTLNIKDYTFMGKENKYVSFFINDLCLLLKNLETFDSNIFIFEENTNHLYVDSNNMNSEFSSPSLRNSKKSVAINTANKSLDFTLTKKVWSKKDILLSFIINEYHIWGSLIQLGCHFVDLLILVDQFFCEAYSLSPPQG